MDTATNRRFADPHVPTHALLIRSDHALLIDGQKISKDVREWLPKVRYVLARPPEKDNRILILGCRPKDINPLGKFATLTAAVNREQILFRNNDVNSYRDTGKPMPIRVGMVMQARFMQHRMAVPVANDAKLRKIPMLPIMPHGDIRNLLLYGLMPEEELFERLRPELPSAVIALMESAAPERRATTQALIEGGIRQYVKGEAVPDPVSTESPDDDRPAAVSVHVDPLLAKPAGEKTGAKKAHAPRGAVAALIHQTPRLPGEIKTDWARRVFEKCDPTWNTTLASIVTSIYLMEKAARAKPTPEPEPAPSPEPESQPAAPPVVAPQQQALMALTPEIVRPITGTLDKTMQALDTLTEALSKVKENAKVLLEEVDFANLAIETVRNDLRAGVRDDMKERMRVAMEVALRGM